MRVAVIGGGASGQLAAIEAAKRGHEVHLYEKNEKLGKKLYITGKGRCNLTNACQDADFFNNVVRNPKFLYSALAAFNHDDIVALMHDNGVETKTERGGRIFPASDKSSDVLKALLLEIDKLGVNVHLNTAVEDVIVEDGAIASVRTDRGEAPFDAAIFACGGLSYPQTGSDGWGLKLLERLGHSIERPLPALIPLETEEDFCAELAGISLKNVRLSAYRDKRKVFFEQGEMLFTHFGVSGPLVLSLSSFIADAPAGVKLYIDFKPALSHEQLEARLMRELEQNQKKQVLGAFSSLLPQKLLKTVLKSAGLNLEAPASDFTREQRKNLAATLKGLPLTVKGTRPIAEAIITRGGVSIKEVNSSTMESKLIRGLFICGEMLDVDALTGGFNLQIAWSTGALAGRSV
ncbi:MAG: NAD(P)/FAD-dependent oxidoreductase [Clostridia bacterium]|nr:NAD(P)/FAD-dependent oxidoreductase [Clostridia bacterium]